VGSERVSIRKSAAEQIFAKLFPPQINRVDIAESGFFQDPHRRDVVWHHQADDPFQAEIGEPDSTLKSA
jgi:hypothetical protein